MPVYLPMLILHSISTLIFLLLSGFFSASETALFSIRREHMAELSAGDFRDRAIHRLLTGTEETLITILLCNLFVNLFIISEVNTLIEMFFPGIIWLRLVGATAILLIFGEIIPKNIAIRTSRPYARFCAPLLEYIRRKITVIIRLFRSVNRRLIYFNSAYILRSPAFFVTREEYSTALRRSREEGLISQGSYALINSFIGISREPVYRCARHRNEGALPAEYSLHGGNTLHGPQKILQQGAPLRTGWFSLNRPVGELLAYLSTEKIDLALINDEYGSFYGYCRLEDIIRFWRNKKRSPCSLTELPCTLTGSTPVEYLAHLIDNTLLEKHRSVNTLNGMICAAAGGIPAPGESICLGDVTVRILDADPRRVLRFQCSPTPGFGHEDTSFEPDCMDSSLS
ncbi:MAG: CNNM domain-containing protein [Fibrobacterota bacterium]